MTVIAGTCRERAKLAAATCTINWCIAPIRFAVGNWKYFIGCCEATLHPELSSFVYDVGARCEYFFHKAGVSSSVQAILVMQNMYITGCGRFTGRNHDGAA